MSHPRTSPSPSVSDSLARVSAIMRRHNVACTPAEFHAAVNVTFHNFESQDYDQAHEDMWQSLPGQFELLANDCVAAQGMPRNGLRMLDIGCGTGLATDCILKTALGKAVGSVDLLDTSRDMLARATERARTWRVPAQTLEGLIDALPPDRQYDLIVTCSVLHHVPDIEGFARSVARLQARDGLFLHAQDPNGDYLTDPETVARSEERRRSRPPEWVARLSPERVLNRLSRAMGKPAQDYVAKTNRSLVASGLLSKPLTVEELYSITDIHVHDGEGISLRRLGECLADYDCVTTRSYGFFGELRSTLPPKFQRKEDALSAQRAPNGFFISAAWRHR